MDVRHSILRFECLTCHATRDSEYFSDKGCQQCGGGRSSHVIFINPDCSTCQHFHTSPLQSPSGSCDIDNTSVGVGYVCDNHKERPKPFSQMTEDELAENQERVIRKAIEDYKKGLDNV